MAMGEDDPDNSTNVKSATDGAVDDLEDGEVEEESESGIQAVDNVSNLDDTNSVNQSIYSSDTDRICGA